MDDGWRVWEWFDGGLWVADTSAICTHKSTTTRKFIHKQYVASTYHASGERSHLKSYGEYVFVFGDLQIYTLNPRRVIAADFGFYTFCAACVSIFFWGPIYVV